MRRALDLAAPAVLIALLLAVWEVACRTLEVPVYILPPPSAVAKAALQDAPILLASAWNTFWIALRALLLAAAIAFALALAAGSYPWLERATAPLAVTVQVTPIVAIAPLAVIWAGLDRPERAILGLAAVVAFFPLFSGAVTGLKAADPDLERLFDLHGASRPQRLFRLRLPSAVPFLLEGARVAAGQAVIGAVVAEYVARTGAAQGLAWRILEAGNRLQIARMFAALLALTLMGAALFFLMRWAEAKILKWRHGR